MHAQPARALTVHCLCTSPPVFYHPFLPGLAYWIVSPSRLPLQPTNQLKSQPTNQPLAARSTSGHSFIRRAACDRSHHTQHSRRSEHQLRLIPLHAPIRSGCRAWISRSNSTRPSLACMQTEIDDRESMSLCALRITALVDEDGNMIERSATNMQQ
jgi:hypothetical protein